MKYVTFPTSLGVHRLAMLGLPSSDIFRPLSAVVQSTEQNRANVGARVNIRDMDVSISESTKDQVFIIYSALF